MLADRDALTEALRRHGLVPVPGAEPAGEFFDGGPCRVEITYLAATASGDVVTPGYEHWPYVSGALLGARVRIHGVEVPVLSVAALIDTKEHW